MNKIIVKFHGETLSEFKVSSSNITIGASEDCDVSLEEGNNVQAEHAVIKKGDGDGWQIESVEGAKIISRGDEIDGHAQIELNQAFLIGEYVITWAEDDDSQAEAAEAEYDEVTLPAVSGPRIRVMSGPNMGDMIDLEPFLEKGPVCLGRKDDNQIVINDRSVSRHHAQLNRDGDSVVLQDAGSRWGITMGEGQMIEEIHLLNGTRFFLGDTEILFEAPIKPLSQEQLEAVDNPALGLKTTGTYQVDEATDPSFNPDNQQQGAQYESTKPPFKQMEEEDTPKPTAAPTGEPKDQMNPAMWPLMLLLFVLIALIIIVAIILLPQT
jgi:predicted component of type VI protein secretion system